MDAIIEAARWLNHNSGFSQVVLAGALVAITFWYTVQTHKMASATRFSSMLQSKSASVQALSVVLSELATPDMGQARRYVLTEDLPPAKEVIQDLGEKRTAIAPSHRVAYETFQPVIASFDRIGALVSLGLIPEGPVLEIYGDLVVKCWARLARYVQRERDLRNQPSYQKHFENLCHRAVRYSNELSERSG